MGNLFNPFRAIAGAKSLVLGLLFIAASSLILWSGGAVQDGYLHYAYFNIAWWRVAVVEVLWWLLPSLILYLIGVVWSRSKIRLVDVLGTTAFSRLAMLPSVTLLVVPYFKRASLEVVQSIQEGAMSAGTELYALIAMGIVSMLCLALFFVWNYKAFSTSCNLRGGWVVTIYIAVQLAITLFGGYLLRTIIL